MKRILFIPAVLVLFLTAAAQASASPIVAPLSAGTTMGQSYPLTNAFNQTGLSATYLSGITDFAPFVAGTTHNSQQGNDWVSTTTAGSVTFDLGSLMAVDALAFWNFGGLGGNPTFAVTQFSLVASVDASFSSPIVLGTFNPAVFATLNPAQVFSFASTNAQFFRLQGFSSNGATALGIGAEWPDGRQTALRADGGGAFARRVPEAGSPERQAPRVADRPRRPSPAARLMALEQRRVPVRIVHTCAEPRPPSSRSR